jgi:hypothetical protein
MKRKLLALLVTSSLVLALLPTFLLPQPVGATYYTFHAIEPRAQVTISTDDAWIDIDATAYGVPVGATGIIYRIKNWEGSGGEDCAFGVRKNGSSDNRINPLWEHTPSWGAIGVDSNGIFEIYKGSETTKFGFWIIGYTTSGVTFFTNAYTKTPALSGWRDIDCSAECPNAIGLIFELVGPSRGEVMINYGFRNNGSTDTFVYNAPDHCAPGIIIGCDANQVCEFYQQYTGYFEVYLIGYITDGAYFYTNAVSQAIGIGAWTDFPTALPAGSVMGFYEFRGSGSAYPHDTRPNGTSYIQGGLDNRHCWAFENCDGSGIVEGYVGGSGITYYLVGYACPGFYSVTTTGATNVDSNSATLNGNIVDTTGEDVELRGFQWGLTQTPTWEWYETGESYTSYGHSSDNYLDNNYKRRGQHVTLLDVNLVALSFRLCKINSPTGDVTYTIRNATSDAILWSEVLCDASALSTSWTWYEIEFDDPFNVNSDVRIAVEFTNGNATDKVDTGHWDTDIGPGCYTNYIFSWSDTSSREMEFKYTYEASGHYSTGAYSHDLTGLDDDESYYYRAYTVTNITTHYGLWVGFSTSNLPVMQTNTASSVAMTTARLNSVVIADGDLPVTVTFGWGETPQTFPEFYDHYQVLPGTYTEGQHPYLDIGSLSPSTLYYFRVMGENTNGIDLGSQLTFTTENLTGAVQNFKGVPSSTSISLSWDLLTGATSYLIRFKFDSYPTSTTDGTQVYLSSSTSTIHEDLAAGTTYYYAIWGHSGGSYSPNSTTLMLTTSAYIEPGDTLPPPEEPTNWMAAPDYTRMSGLGYFYDGVNGSADWIEMPRATLWFLLALGLCLFLTFAFYLKIRQSRGAGTLTIVVLTILLFFGWILRLFPFWVPLLSVIGLVGLAISHKEVTN